MRKHLSAVAVAGSVGAALLAAACGLGFSDIEIGAGTSPTGTTVPTGTPTGTTTTTGTATTPPGGDASPPLTDGALPGDASPEDAGANLDAGDARPPATTATPSFAFRFELNGICGIFPTVYCTRNDGNYGPRGTYRGMSADIGGTPNVTGAGTNFWKANNSGTDFLEVENVGDVVPAATATKLTVAAWVRRSNDRRRDSRIVSLGPKTGGGAPGDAVFEFGIKAENETKLVLSLDEDLDRGEMTGQPGQVPANVWTFVAATYDGSLANGHTCFYRGFEGTGVTLIECRDDAGRTMKRVNNVRLAVGGPANDRHRANNDRSFAGAIDNVFVYVGEALDAVELEKLRAD